MKKIISLVIAIIIIFTFAGCSQKKQVPDVSVNDIMTKIKEQMATDFKEQGASGDILKDGKLKGFFETDLKGKQGKIFAKNLDIDLEGLDEGIHLQHMINIRSDLIIVLRAKDESKVENLKASLEKVKQAQVKTWQQYLPDQYEKVKNNIIKTKGKYLLYVTYNDPEKIEEIFDNILK